MTTLKVKNRLRFGIVPNALLEDKRLSLQARALAAWLIGRADGFEIRVEALKKMLGITDKIWVSVRKELEKVGWWKSEKFRVPSDKGKNKGRPIFKWEHEFEFLEGSTCILKLGIKPCYATELSSVQDRSRNLMNSPAKLTLVWGFPISRADVPLSPRMREGVWAFASYAPLRRL